MLDYSKNPILEMKNIKKEFSGVYALSGITFDLYESEVHCLVGENGAGKSTLMKVLSGAYTATEGEISVGGKSFSSLTPNVSKEMGINIVYQENDLVPSMNIVENIFVGNEIEKGAGFIDFAAMLVKTKKQIEELDLHINPLTKIEDLSVSDQQFVKILKALSVEPKILIMDEPTSMFNIKDADKVLQLVRRIAQRGIGIIYISHYLEEIRKIADRVTVIRDGQVIRTYDNKNKDLSIKAVTQDMVGRSVDTFYQKEKQKIGEELLKVEGLRIAKDTPALDFSVRTGEILGFAGMVGSGRTEIMRALTGADRKYEGRIFIHGKEVDIKNPRQGISAGFAHITEDRQGLGLMLGISVLENATIVGMKNRIKGFFINIKKHAALIDNMMKKLKVKTPSVWTEVRYLSGGNQQKVVLGKWLFADQEIYIFDEPTRGIDVNAKAEFYKYMSELCSQGKCILLVSSDMPELISMSDRVLVIRKGEIADELTGDAINENEIINRALGVEAYVE